MLFREVTGSGRWAQAFAWTALGLLLLLCLPLFLCLPLWADVTLYDLAARAVLRGGIPYRDVFDTNLPGMVWLHLVIRTLLGWRSETIRGVDLVVVAASVGLLVHALRREGASRAVSVWTAVALLAFYLSTAESSHCQRDVWMLLPALAALRLRSQQVGLLTDPQPSPRRIWTGAWAEGLCWGLAFWIKPHVAVPALTCWLVSTLGLYRRSAGRKSHLAVDAAGLLMGGLAIGGLATVWLLQSGAWPHFWAVFLDWNPEYYSQSTGFSQHTRDVFLRFRPWSQVHYVALPLALVRLSGSVPVRASWCWLVGRISHPSGLPGRIGNPSYAQTFLRGLRAIWSAASGGQAHSGRKALLAAFYLAWLLQAAYLQKGHDYVLLPPVLLALTVVAGHLRPLERRPIVGVAAAALAVYLTAHHPLLHPKRLALWMRCWGEHSTAEIRDRLKLAPAPSTVHWVELERVAVYLRNQGVADGELTCYNNFTHPLYLDLDLQPSTPYLHFDTLLTAFPRHREVMRQRLSGGRQRFVVSDLDAVQGKGRVAEISDGSLTLPAGFPQEYANLFPWTEPILFRSGHYLVHQVTGPASPLASETSHNLKVPRAARRTR